MVRSAVRGSSRPGPTPLQNPPINRAPTESDWSEDEVVYNRQYSEESVYLLDLGISSIPTPDQLDPLYRPRTKPDPLVLASASNWDSFHNVILSPPTSPQSKNSMGSIHPFSPRIERRATIPTVTICLDTPSAPSHAVVTQHLSDSPEKIDSPHLRYTKQQRHQTLAQFEHDLQHQHQRHSVDVISEEDSLVDMYEDYQDEDFSPGQDDQSDLDHHHDQDEEEYDAFDEDDQQPQSVYEESPRFQRGAPYQEESEMNQDIFFGSSEPPPPANDLRRKSTVMSGYSGPTRAPTVIMPQRAPTIVHKQFSNQGRGWVKRASTTVVRPPTTEPNYRARASSMVSDQPPLEGPLQVRRKPTIIQVRPSPGHSMAETSPVSSSGSPTEIRPQDIRRAATSTPDRWTSADAVRFQMEQRRAATATPTRALTMGIPRYQGDHHNNPSSTPGPSHAPRPASSVAMYQAKDRNDSPGVGRQPTITRPHSVVGYVAPPPSLSQVNSTRPFPTRTQNPPFPTTSLAPPYFPNQPAVRHQTSNSSLPYLDIGAILSGATTERPALPSNSSQISFHPSPSGLVGRLHPAFINPNFKTGTGNNDNDNEDRSSESHDSSSDSASDHSPNRRQTEDKHNVHRHRSATNSNSDFHSSPQPTRRRTVISSSPGDTPSLGHPAERMLSTDSLLVTPPHLSPCELSVQPEFARHHHSKGGYDMVEESSEEHPPHHHHHHHYDQHDQHDLMMSKRHQQPEAENIRVKLEIMTKDLRSARKAARTKSKPPLPQHATYDQSLTPIHHHDGSNTKYILLAGPEYEDIKPSRPPNEQPSSSSHHHNQHQHRHSRNKSPNEDESDIRQREIQAEQSRRELAEREKRHNEFKQWEIQQKSEAVRKSWLRAGLWSGSNDKGDKGDKGDNDDKGDKGDKGEKAAKKAAKKDKEQQQQEVNTAWSSSKKSSKVWKKEKV